MEATGSDRRAQCRQSQTGQVQISQARTNCCRVRRGDDRTAAVCSSLATLTRHGYGWSNQSGKAHRTGALAVSAAACLEIASTVHCQEDGWPCYRSFLWFAHSIGCRLQPCGSDLWLTATTIWIMSCTLIPKQRMTSSILCFDMTSSILCFGVMYKKICPQSRHSDEIS